MSNHDQQSNEEAMTLPRRDFILLGSVAVAGVAASGLSSNAIRTIVAPAAGSVLSVGFAESIRGERQAVHSAARAPRTSSLGSSARITVHGVWRPEESRNTPLGIGVATYYPGALAPLPVIAWNYRSFRSSMTGSGRTSFEAPLQADGSLAFSIERTTPGAPKLVGMAKPRRFSFSREAKQPLMPNLAALEKSGDVCRLTADVLQQGTYFVALRSSWSDRAPDWSMLHVAENAAPLQPHGPSVLRTAVREVPFEYLMVSIDRVG
jgi:hypothetical protein